MRKPYLQKPEFLTYEQVQAEIAEYRAKYAPTQTCRKRDGTVVESPTAWWMDHKGEEFGFEYEYQYVKLEGGWVVAPEMVCPYCVAMLVKVHGSEADRLKFNAVNPLGPGYHCWITNKEYAAERKRRYKTRIMRNLRRSKMKRYKRQTARTVLEFKEA